MSLRPPRFWDDAGHPASRLLSPFGAVYAGAGAARLAFTKPYRASIPVICTGNVSMGGVGKTPWTLLLRDILAAKGRTPHVLSRGYGGTAKGPLRVAGHMALEVGDEALMMSAEVPVWVGADRAASARAAAADGADVLLLDDGFQNPGLAKDYAFLAVDAQALFGNGEVFPAGPLRERPEAAAARANAFVSVGHEGTPVPERVAALADGKPVFRAWLELDTRALVSARPVHAFAGIGRPQRFFDALARAGFAPAAATCFADHHPFTGGELDALVAAAKTADAQLVTTQKDMMRIPQHARQHVVALPAGMRTDDETALADILARAATA